jgi:hypothetical protein
VTHTYRTALIATAVILLAVFTYVAAAAGHPLIVYNAYELEEDA